jgi:C4-dicarboxylate-specific signal transduction histidine kinase
VTSGRLSWRDLTPPEWRDADDRRAAEVKTLGVAQPYEKEYFRKGGGRVPVLVGGAAFEKDAEEGVGFVVDLSDRKRAELEVRESERRYREVEIALARANRIATLGHMSASIAHEINQPIAATVTNAQAALRFLEIEQPDIEEVRQALRRIARLGNRVAEVITRVRALVKNQPARKEEFDINEAIREVLSFREGELVKNGVSAKTSFADGLSLVAADRVQLQQVIVNLMMNAIEAMASRPEGSRELHISTVETRAREIVVSVEDSGPGLNLTQPERAFDVFYSTKPEGLGIGLSICRSIVEAHGGRLWAAAASELGGAAFTFTLPAQPDSSSAACDPASSK